MALIYLGYLPLNIAKRSIAGFWERWHKAERKNKEIASLRTCKKV